MPLDTSPDPITRLYRACEPSEALQPDDPRYVNCDEVRGDSVVQMYARSLRRADPARPQVQLFAGHRGVGKTSELNRLKRMLERPVASDNPHKPFMVVYMDTSERLDLNDLDFPDLLVFVAAEVQEHLKNAHIPGFSPTTSLLQNAWDQIKAAIPTGGTLKEAGIDAPFGSLTIELKNRPNSRKELRDAIERNSTGLLNGVNDLLDTAVVKLRETGREGLVLIIDGLERLVFRSLEWGGTTHDRLFLDRSDQLASLRAHVIYTCPISLFYSSRCAQLEQTFGDFNVPVPMIRLHERTESVDDASPGMHLLERIIAKRCVFAEVPFESVFDSAATQRYLCRMSGGHPRHLMMFLQSAMSAVDSLPITQAAAEKAVRNYGNSLLREVPDDYWPKLKMFDAPQESVPKDEAHQQMLFLLHLFEYMNGRPWYEVNPIIRTLDRFNREN